MKRRGYTGTRDPTISGQLFFSFFIQVNNVLDIKTVGISKNQIETILRQL